MDKNFYAANEVKGQQITQAAIARAQFLATTNNTTERLAKLLSRLGGAK